MSQPSFQSFADLFQSSEFIHRHVGISQDEKEAMLKAVGADSMASFIEQTVLLLVLVFFYHQIKLKLLKQ